LPLSQSDSNRLRELSKLLAQASNVVDALLPQAVEDERLDMPLEETGISVRTFNKALRSGIGTLRGLVVHSEEQLLARKLGKRAVDEIKETLARLNLHLNMTDQELVAWSPPPESFR
jgi:DNA-directed RNA polymerase alpha subunit